MVAWWHGGINSGGIVIEIFRNPKKKFIQFKPDKGKIIKRIDNLNKYYESHDFCISILKKTNVRSSEVIRIMLPYSDYQMSLQDINTAESDNGNFFFYPTHKIFEIDGNEKKLIGFRICCIKLVFSFDIDGKEYEIISLSFNIDELKTGKWLKDANLKEGGFKAPKRSINKLMESLLKMNIENSILIFPFVGWNLFQKKMYYIPFSLGGKEDKIYVLKNTVEDFKFELDKDLDANQAYNNIQGLLNLTDKKITIPLFSFTIISSLLTLMKLFNDEYPRFSICLSGNQDGSKEELANIFCAIYNRSKHIKRLDGILHTNYKLKVKLLEEKIEKIRDAVFIGNIENAKNKSPYLKLIERNSSSLPPCGLLLLFDNPIKQDSVLNISINEAIIDENILQIHKSRPSIHTNWFNSFISYIQKSKDSPKWRIGKKGNIDKLYNECMDRIDDGKSDYDINLMRHHAWLLMGYMLFLRHGVSLQVMNNKEQDVLINNAVLIFRDSCKIESKKDDPSASYSGHDLAVIFMDALDKTLKDEWLIGVNDDCIKTEILRKDRSVLYVLKKNIFGFVEEYTKGNEREIISSKDKTSIYNYLHEKNIIITRTVEKNSKKRYGIRLKSANNQWFIDFNIKLTKQFLEENGCELVFFNNN